MGRLARALVLLAAVSSCRKQSAAPPLPPPLPPGAAALDAGRVVVDVTDAGPVAASGGDAGRTFSPELAVPLTESTLSLLEPGEGGCRWLRVDPLAQKQAVVARFEGDCQGARLAFSRDSSRALVWFDPSTRQRVSFFARGYPPPAYAEEPMAGPEAQRLYRVDLMTGKVEPLPLVKARGKVEEIALDEQGRPVALALESLDEKALAAGQVRVDGQSFPVGPGEGEGMPALAHAYRYEEGGWKRVETQPTTEGSDVSVGVRGLSARTGFGVRTADVLEAHYQGDSVVDAAIGKQLERLSPGEPGDTDGFIQGGTSAGAFFAWEVQAEYSYTTGLVLLRQGRKVVRPPGLGFTASDLVALRTSGAYLLVATSLVGSHPRMYDLRSQQRVFGSDAARAAIFWPGSAPPGEAEH